MPKILAAGNDCFSSAEEQKYARDRVHPCTIFDCLTATSRLEGIRLHPIRFDNLLSRLAEKRGRRDGNSTLEPSGGCRSHWGRHFAASANRQKIGNVRIRPGSGVT